jgi:HEAT repeat protein
MSETGDDTFPPALADIDLDPESGATSDEQARRCLEVLRDPEIDPEVRGRAATVLGPGLQLGDEVVSWDDPMDLTYFSREVWDEVGDVLARIYRDGDEPKIVRRRVLEAAVRGPRRDWIDSAVRAAWQSGDPDWMLTAVFAMGWLPGFGAELAEAFQDPPDERVLREAIRIAGEHERNEFAPRVEEIASGKTDHERLTRLAAIEALGTIDVTRLETWQVLDELSRHSDPEIVERAEWALEAYYLYKGMYEEMPDDFV